MQRLWTNERGMALAVALFALVVVGALVAGAFFIGTQEQRMGENQYRLGQSGGVAEAGAPEIIRNWDTQAMNGLRIYPLDTLRITDRNLGSGSYGGQMYKLNRYLYYIQLTGSDAATRGNNAALRRRGGGAQQRVGMVARIRPFDVPMRGAFITRGTTTVSGNTLTDGVDRTPNATWTNCAPPDTAKSGIYTNGPVAQSGTPVVSGNPPVKQDATINDQTFNQFGDVTYAQLAAMATKVFPSGFAEKPQPSLLNGVCNKADPLNWGDPITRTNPCGNYFPIIHIRGDGSLTNYQGQGVLLVDGNLSVTGSIQFYGVVIVKGALLTSGGGTSPAHFFGMVMAQNQNNLGNSISGSARVFYSKCAIVEAIQGTWVGAQIRSRSFVTLY